MKTALLVLASTLVGLLLCESGLRLFTRYGAEASPGLAVAVDKPLGSGDAMQYLAYLAAAPGTDRQWFAEDPAPLPNRSPVSAKDLERFKDYERRGIFGAQADYVWNARFVESTFCSLDNFFQKFPEKILVFEPQSGDPHPRYRFPPDTTTPLGLVTNQFGLRGPPITLTKPSQTVRIAFLGASTTVGFHHFAYSYPERVVHWLNRFAESQRYDVRFEGLNAGRYGLNSEDIAPIVRDELLSLDPDLAVYYEGSNQFTAANALVSPHIPTRREIDPNDRIAEHKVPEPIRAHLALGNLLDHVLNGFSSVGEPRKPMYRLAWPAGVDEQNPNVDSPNLPLQLPVIVKDLDSIRNSLASIGSQLVLCSFEWFAKDGLPLSPTRHQYIYQQLNTVLWPLRYADIRRLADFQNRVFLRYAIKRGIPFVDVASAVPQDPNLFWDAIHMTDSGERLKAWIVFQQIIPLVRRKIESGQLPRPAGARLPPPPSMATSEMRVRCGDAPPGTLSRIDGVISLDAIKLVPGKGSLQLGHPAKVITPAEQWAYAASFRLHLPAGLTGRPFILLRAHVVNGQIGIGVLDHRSDSFQLEKSLGSSPNWIDIYLPVLSPERADELIIRNTAPGGVRSEVLIEDVGLLVASKSRPK